MLSSRRDHRWLLGAGGVCLGSNEVLGLAAFSECSWHSLSWATAGRWPRSQVHLQPCTPQPASLLCMGCHPAQEESSSFPCHCKGSAYVSNTFFKFNEKVAVWVLQRSCCRINRIIPNLLSSDYLEADFNKVCVGMVCKFKRWLTLELWLSAHHKWWVEDIDVVSNL